MNFASVLKTAIFQNASEKLFLVPCPQMKIASYFLKLFQTLWGLWKWWKNGIEIFIEKKSLMIADDEN